VRCKLKGDFMTKVRVSEETSNLSHSSNLISAIGLRNPSPSLMRLIRARGRTHFLGCSCILVERARERSSLRRETAFAEGEHASQGKEQARFSRQQTARKNKSYHTDFRRPYTIKCAQKSRRTTAAFSESIGTHSKAVVQH
jgi:hypothetical protein